MADSLKDLKKQLEDFRKEYEKISKKPAAVFDTSNVEKTKRAIDQMELAIDRARENAYKLSQGFVGIREELEGVLSGLGDQDSAIKKATRSLRKIKNIYEKLESDQLGISRLNLKELKTLDKKNKEEQKYLKLQISELKGKKNLTDEEAEALALAERDYAVLTKGNEKLKERLNTEKDINKTIGLTGAAFKGISGTLSKIGVDSDALNSINEDIYDTAEKGGSSFQVMGTAIKGSAGALKDALLNDALVQLVVIQKIYSAVFKLLSHASQSTFELSQNLATSNENAFKAYNQIKEFAYYADESSTTLDRLLKTNSSLNNTLGTSVVFSKQQLETQSKLTNVLGLNEQEAAGILSLSLGQGKSQEEIVDSIRLQGNGLVNSNEVLKEISTATGQLGFNYRKNTDQLAKSVFEAKRLGINLDDAKGISSALLDFESSIAGELEAELLTGKDLNFERARQLALQGKSVEAAIEIRKQVGSAAEFGKMNVIQQEALAKAAGMTVDQLSDSLRKEEQLAAIAKSKGISLAEAAKLREQEEAATQRLANSADRVKTAFTSLAVKYLTPLVEKFATFLENIEKNEAFKGLVKTIGGLATGAGLIGSVGLALKTLFGGRRGSRPTKPMYVALSGMGKGMGTLSKGISTAVGKSLKGVSSLLGGKKTMAGRALRGVAAEKIATGAGKSVSKVAGKTASKTGGKGLAKIAGKFAGKGALKRIPLLGSVVGLGFAVDRAMKGDFAGAAMEVGSAGLGLLDLVVPGLGSGLSLAADAGIAARDFKKAGTITPTATPMATGGIVTQPTRALVGEAGAEAVVPLNEFYKKFDELIAAVNKGGNVYLDSTKVGTAMAVGTYKVQ